MGATNTAGAPRFPLTSENAAAHTSRMALFSKLLLFFLGGGALGNALTSVVAPRYLVWDFSPREGISMCNCADTVRSATGALVRYQLIGTLVGAVGLLVLGAVLHRMGAKRPPVTPPAS